MIINFIITLISSILQLLQSHQTFLQARNNWRLSLIFLSDFPTVGRQTDRTWDLTLLRWRYSKYSHHNILTLIFSAERIFRGGLFVWPEGRSPDCRLQESEVKTSLSPLKIVMSDFFIRVESAEEMELIMEKIPESLKKRMSDEEKLLRKEESCLQEEREASELWRLRQLQLTPVVRSSDWTLAQSRTMRCMTTLCCKYYISYIVMWHFSNEM